MIGLLTPYNVQNYGTKLQAFAVQELMSVYDDVEIINFRHNLPERVKRKIEKKVMGEYFSDSKCSNKKELDEELKRKRNTAISSIDRKLKIAPKIYGYENLKKKAAEYKAVVCGSDQIWNPVNLPEHIYMLEFVPDMVRRIALSPSFGIPAIPTNLRHTYKKRLSHIEYMSVREKSGCEIVSDLGFKTPCWMLDPTLIMPERKWHDLADESAFHIDEKYIFCYFLGSHSKGRDGAAKLRSLTGYKIVNLPHFKSYVDADENFADHDLYDIAPQDFLSLIRNAQYVCTDSFHGTAFSIIYEKQFMCFERHQASDKASTNDRIYSVLQLIGESGRLIRDVDSIKDLVADNHDFSNAKRVLNSKREEANHFLDNAVKGKRC
ncbi:polysaccharide pyruvyl transferase family protein [Oscillospiraceae bacterium HV4-5-C5C]|nr:polysaccharide pyruvyl transferase family protein [Oscillospiraceae bacterium HV4-5-C5C]